MKARSFISLFIKGILRVLALFIVVSGASCTTLSNVKSRDKEVVKTKVLKSDGLAEKLLALQQSPEPSPTELTEAFAVSFLKKLPLRHWRKPVRVKGKSGEWELSFHDQVLDLQGIREWSPSMFDRLVPASRVKLEGYNRIVAGCGAGLPVVLAYEDVDALRAEREFRPSNGLYVPGTLVFEFGDSRGPGHPTPVRCRILNTTTERAWKVGGKKEKLAYNQTAVIEINLGNRYIRRSALGGLVRPGVHVEKDMGLFALSSFDPDKIPVVFVHGLESAPHIWRNAVNEICADPKLSERYLPILFMYPSGLAVPMAAAQLKRNLQQYRALWDPHKKASSFDQMVLVGHSMGGLLSRLQVMDSGDDMWRAFFSKPPSQIEWIEEDDKQRLEESLKFAAHPSVKRVVFIAVPHRGSNVADIGIVRLAIRLIQVPKNSAKYVAHALAEDTSLINPALLRFHALGMRSVDMLSPEHPYFSAINKRPIKVPYHSIIGNRGRDLGEKSSDGIVPYWSSHLPGAESEDIVPYGHRCTLKLETVEAINRILELHLDEL